MHSIGKVSVTAIYVPTTRTIKGLEKRGFSLIDELQEALQPLRLQYQQLTNKDLDDHYDGDTAAMGPKHRLHVMECFYRLTPMHSGRLPSSFSDGQVWRAALEVSLYQELQEIGLSPHSRILRPLGPRGTFFSRSV